MGAHVVGKRGRSLARTASVLVATVLLASGAVIAGTPAYAFTAPGAPTNVTATAGVSGFTVSWTAPSSNGGSAITDYIVKQGGTNGLWSPGSLFDPADSSDRRSACSPGMSTSCSISSNSMPGTYTFVVFAVNAVGESAASTASASVSAWTAPGAPTNISGTASNGKITVSWSAPSSNGGTAVTGYLVKYRLANMTWYPGSLNNLSSSGSTACQNSSTTSPATTCDVSVFNDGSSYLFAVYAINAVGTGSSAGQAASTVASLSPPGMVGSVVATPALGQITVQWGTPGSTGGSPITGYLVQQSTNGSTWTPSTAGVSACASSTTSTATSCNVTVANDGTTYYFRVYSMNAIGTTSMASSPSPAATALSPPGVPTSVVAAAVSGQMNVSWTAPVSGLIDGYRVQMSVDSGAWTPSSTSSSVCSGSLTSLSTSCAFAIADDGASYRFRVYTVNAVGESSASSDSAAAVAVAPPVPSSSGASTSAPIASMPTVAPAKDEHGKPATPAAAVTQASGLVPTAAPARVAFTRGSATVSAATKAALREQIQRGGALGTVVVTTVVPKGAGPKTKALAKARSDAMVGALRAAGFKGTITPRTTAKRATTPVSLTWHQRRV